MESPRARLSARPRHRARAHVALTPRGLTGAAAAATALTLSSRGNALVLVVALALVARHPVRIAATAAALVASMVRWGTSSLGAIAGAQAVLGPAGWTGSGAAVASAWLGAAALVLATPSLVAAVPFGLAAATVAVGPGPGGSIGWRVVASAVAIALGAGVATLLQRRAAQPPPSVRRQAPPLVVALSVALVVAAWTVVLWSDVAPGSYTDAIAVAVAGGAIGIVTDGLVRSRAL